VAAAGPQIAALATALVERPALPKLDAKLHALLPPPQLAALAA
jgi:hypothetical protein